MNDKGILKYFSLLKIYNIFKSFHRDKICMYMGGSNN